MHGSVRRKYETLCEAAHLEPDAAQRALADRFDQLAAAIAEQRPKSKKSALGWLFAGGAKPEPVRGLYVWGAVGRGKTMLMDLFAEAVPGSDGRRTHFHEFMADVHERINEFRKALREGTTTGSDPIVPVADQIADRTRLLCFDEFTVTDIADAMILGRLFERLFQRGVTVVATSNVPPDDLYKDGLNRALFLPFIALLKTHMAVLHLDAPQDYRLAKLGTAPVYLTPADAAAARTLDQHFERLSGVAKGKAQAIAHKGRSIAIPQAAGGVARFGFGDLCDRPLGAGDYLKVARSFHTLIIDGIPVMDVRRRNQARRFITLIDTLYDNGVKLVVAETAEHLTVFQRTPNYSIPAHNKPLDDAFKSYIKESHDEIHAVMMESTGGHPFSISQRKALDVSEEERQAIYEKAWSVGGLRFRSAFQDLLIDKDANDTAAEFIKGKIRQIVKDPKTAAMLTDIDHPYSAKRPPIDTDYFETFNRDNVTLVDVRADPIQRITETGIDTGEAHYELDTIIFATGFDAMTGPLLSIDVRGKDGLRIQDAWAEGPKTYLGLQIAGFPNLFTVTGPGSPSVLTNMPASIEQHVEWITDCIESMLANGKSRIEATPGAVEDWVEETNRAANATLFPQAKHSWYLGANVPGKPVFSCHMPVACRSTATVATKSPKMVTRGSRSPDAASAPGRAHKPSRATDRATLAGPLPRRGRSTGWAYRYAP